MNGPNYVVRKPDPWGREDGVSFMGTAKEKDMDDSIRSLEKMLKIAFSADQIARMTRRFIVTSDMLYVVWEQW